LEKGARICSLHSLHFAGGLFKPPHFLAGDASTARSLPEKSSCRKKDENAK
jgi:hypothetical protein